VEVAIDLSGLGDRKGDVQNYINNEAIINEGLRISLSVTSPDKGLETLLEYAGKALKCDRCYVFEENDDHTYDNTYEWCSTESVPQKDNLQKVPYSDVKIWIEHFKNKDNITIRDLEDIKDSDPAMYDLLLPQDIHTLVASPLVFDNKIIGFYGVDNPPPELMENISTLFLIMGHFIVSLLRRRDLYKRLKHLSFYDELTGFGNRHYMGDYIAEMRKEDSIGIVYCDVMGLKKTNDTLGHKAGDELLVRACNSLKQAFPKSELFRLGGDEFLVLCSRKTEKEFNEKVELLQKIMTENNAMMAVGCIWRTDSSAGMTKLLAEADELMYEDKRKRYAEKNMVPRNMKYKQTNDNS
jgi:diguanylate cyclase (GGDEF)-like protein